MVNLTTYQEIKVEPFELDHIEVFKITKVPNQHSKLVLTGILPEDTEDSYVEKALAEKNIKVIVETEEDSKIIFCGLIQTIEVSTRASTYCLEIEAISHSVSLDIERVRRSYQDLSMLYSDLMIKAVERYDGDVMDKVTDETTIDNFILQYDETPWEFVMRMASRFNVPISRKINLKSLRCMQGFPKEMKLANWMTLLTR